MDIIFFWVRGPGSGSGMRQLSFLGLKVREKKSNKDKVIKLNQRDLEILEFVLDMKFVSVNDVYRRFFSITLSGEKAKSNEWAIRRLQQLEWSGYLKGVFSFSERTKFYLATGKAYQFVSKSKPEEEILKPSAVIDHRTFTHDRYVLEARIILENRKAAECWISDKKLRSSTELSGGLTLSNVPDGIYFDLEGKRVALEMELSQKSHKDYLNKIKKYVSMMRSEDRTINVFDRVLYVCAKRNAHDFLVKETKIYGNLFEVKTFSEFFTEGVSFELLK